MMIAVFNSAFMPSTTTWSQTIGKSFVRILPYLFFERMGEEADKPLDRKNFHA